MTGSVTIPRDAAPGAARLRFQLPATSRYRSVPVEFAVTIE
jgi:hypothetical protein